MVWGLLDRMRWETMFLMDWGPVEHLDVEGRSGQKTAANPDRLHRSCYRRQG